MKCLKLNCKKNSFKHTFLNQKYMQNYNFNKSILSDFSWNNLTWLGWMLSIGEFLNTILNLEVLLEKSIQEEWNLKKITHKKFKIIMQKIYCILAWIKTNNSDVYIKNDPVFKKLLWKIVPKTTLNHYGLKVPYSKMKLSTSKLDGFLWCSKYCWIKSSDTIQVLHAQYYIAQKWRHQYFFCNSGNSCWSFLDVLHLVSSINSMVTV